MRTPAPHLRSLFALCMVWYATILNAQPSLDELQATLRDHGTVRVIVGFEFEDPFVPEGYLPDSGSIQAQRNAIARSREALLSNLAPTGAETLAEYQRIPFVALEVNEEALSVLSSLPTVTSIVEDVAVPPVLGSDDSRAVSQVWTGDDNGNGRSIAVLDTGVEAGHPYLGGRVVTEACYSTTSSSHKSTSLCPSSLDSQLGAGAASPTGCADIAGCDQGTHVAGIAAGSGTEFYGVARAADIIAMQVFSRFEDPEACGGSTSCLKSFASDQLEAFQRVADLSSEYAIASVYLSPGTGRYSQRCDTVHPAFTAMIETLRSIGIATVVPAGDDGLPDATTFPGCLSSAITVGATTSSGQLAAFSNRSEWVDLVAPGVGIHSSITGAGYGTKSGTSMAAAHVAGAWAVLGSSSPEADVDETLQSLVNGAPVVVEGDLQISSLRIDTLSEPGQETLYEPMGLTAPDPVNDLEASPPVNYLPTLATAADSSGEANVSWGADKAVNGDSATAWSTPPRSVMQDEFITLDLGGEKTVGRLRLRSRAETAATFPVDFMIQWSLDDLEYFDALSVVGFDAEAGTEHPFSFDPVNARYIRLWITRVEVYGNGSYYTQIAEIAADTAQIVPNALSLTWTSSGDDGMVGTATAYDLRWSFAPIDEGNFDSATPLDVVDPPALAGQREQYLLGLLEEGVYYFALKVIDDAGNISAMSNLARAATLGTAPGAVNDLEVTTITNDSVTLTWTAPGDDDDTGTASFYHIRYSESPLTDGNFATASQPTSVPTPAPAGTPESLVIDGLDGATTYYFALKTEDEAENVSALSNVAIRLHAGHGCTVGSASFGRRTSNVPGPGERNKLIGGCQQLMESIERRRCRSFNGLVYTRSRHTANGNTHRRYG